MVVDRMKAWREAKLARSGGMHKLQTWVPLRHAGFLKQIFEKLGDPSSRGDDYRLIASSWLSRRRAQRAEYSGTDYSAEIDLPSFGPWWFSKPAGGRVYGSFETWIELDPNEADEVNMLCKSAVSEALEKWLKGNGQLGKLKDHVGVTLRGDFTDPDYRRREGDIVIRPQTDAEFEKNEARIARDVEREALMSTRHPTDDPTVVYYEGFDGVPSRCHAIHRRVGDRILFALLHIQYGGISPTNMIEDLTVEMWKRFYPSDPFKNIDWYDCFTVWEGAGPQINRVKLDRDRWCWESADDLPADFIEEIKAAAQTNPRSDS